MWSPSAPQSAVSPISLPLPLLLQRRAKEAHWEHVRRSIVRVLALLTADMLSLVLIRSVALGIRDAHWLGGAPAALLESMVSRSNGDALKFVLSVVLGLIVMGTYGQGDHRRDSGKMFAGATFGALLLFWHRFFTDPGVGTAAGFVLTSFALGTALIIDRSLVERFVHRFRVENRHAARALFIGFSDTSRSTMRAAPFADTNEFEVLGYLDLDDEPADDALGGVDHLATIISERKVDTIIVTTRVSDAMFESLHYVADAAGCALCVAPAHRAPPGVEPRIVWHHGAPLVHFTTPGFRGPQLVIKRAFDIVGSVVGMVVASPLFIAVGVAIKLTSRGPVLFRQERVGLGGRTFGIYKFRSMVADAEHRLSELKTRSIYADDKLFKMVNDPRITRLGAFLRKSSLDELPQLWNVLRGDMSLVGPRPPLPSEVALYEEHHYARFMAKPGVTGPWQVSGRNAITDFDEVVRLETDYMRGWTIWRDIEITLRTIPVVLMRTGAH